MKLSRLMAAFAVTVSAAQGIVFLGSDFASDSAYDIMWDNTTDGGAPATFGAWTLTSTGAEAGLFIGDSTSLALPGADINMSGESFGMFGHTGQTSEALRDFNGNSLGVGQTFFFDMAVNFRNGNKGFDLRDSLDNVLFNFNVGVDDYVVNNATTGSGTIGNTYSDNTAFQLSFTQTSGTGGTWDITRSGGVSTSDDSGTYTGVAENFKFYESQTDNGSAQNNLFFNSLTVVPEPSSALLGLLGATLLLRRRRI